MALTPQDAAKLAQQLQEIERLSRLLGANINTINLQPIEANAGNIEAIFQKLTNQAAGLGEETDYLISNFQKLVGEIKNSGTGVNNTTKALRGLSSITEQISSYQKGYNDLSSKEIAKLKDKVQIETDRLKIAKDTLREESQDIRQKITNNNLQGRALQIELDKLAKINIARRNTLNLLRNEDITLGELNNKLKEAEDDAIHMEKTLGLTGATLKGISKIPFLGDIIDTNNALKAAKDNIKEGGDRTSAMKAAFKNMGGQIKTNLTDPLVVVGFLFTQMLEALKGADKGAGDLAKGFNMTYDEAIKVREELTQMAETSGDVALNTRALQESMMAVGKSLGSNAMLNKEDLATFTKLREQAGFTNEELLGIEKTTLATGGNLEENAKNILYSAKLTGLNNKVLLNEKDIMRDVAKASDATKLSLGGSGKKLGEAAAQAKSLGMNLEQVDKIAGSLLDFESSITNELSAELITGKQLNLEQARLYALNNDTAGVAREIAKNFGSAAEFSKMNRISQESIAKAVGMTREELATTLTDQAALKGLSGDKLKDAQASLNLARAQGMTEDQIAQQGVDGLMKQQSVQERLNQSVEKLKEIFVSIAEPILEILSPLMDLVTAILPPIVGLLQPVLGVFKAIAHVVAGIVQLLTFNLTGAMKSFGSVGSDLVGGVTSSTQFKMAKAVIGGDSETKMAKGGIVTSKINNVTIGEAGSEAIIPLNSPKADKYLGGGNSTPQQPQSLDYDKLANIINNRPIQQNTQLKLDGNVVFQSVAKRVTTDTYKTS